MSVAVVRQTALHVTTTACHNPVLSAVAAASSARAQRPRPTVLPFADIQKSNNDTWLTRAKVGPRGPATLATVNINVTILLTIVSYQPKDDSLQLKAQKNYVFELKKILNYSQ